MNPDPKLNEEAVNPCGELRYDIWRGEGISRPRCMQARVRFFFGPNEEDTPETTHGGWYD